VITLPLFCNEYVCLFVCLSVCLSTWITGKPNFRTSSNFMHVACDCGSIILCRRCGTLCTSGFMDDVMFSYSSTTLFRSLPVFSWVHHNAASGQSLLNAIAMFYFWRKSALMFLLASSYAVERACNVLRMIFCRPYYRSCLLYTVSSVCRLSVTFFIVAKRFVLAKNCLKEWLGNQGPNSQTLSYS